MTGGGGVLGLDASNSNSAERVSTTIARIVTWYVSYPNEPVRSDAKLKGHEMNLAELKFTFTSSKALLAVLNVALLLLISWSQTLRHAVITM